MQDQLDLLKSVKDNTELRKEYESFMKDLAEKVRTYRRSDASWSTRKPFYNSVETKLSDKIYELSSKYSIATEALTFYFAMDKRLYSLICYEVNKNLRREMSLKGGNFSNYRTVPTICGNDLEDCYGWNQDENITDFLTENMDLFPTSSRNYIKSKIPVETEEWNAEKIVNEFQKKVFMRELPEKAQKARLLALVDKFYQLEDDTEQLLTFHHFYSAVNEKYSGKNERGSKMAKDEIMHYYFDNLVCEIDYCDSDNPISSNKPLNTLKTAFIKDSETLLKVIEKAKEYDPNLPLLFFLYNCDKNNKHLIIDQVLEHVHDLSTDSFNLNLFSDSLKEQLFLEIESQYSETGNFNYDD